MKTLTFIRHGESTANAGGITMAHDAIPLSEIKSRLWHWPMPSNCNLAGLWSRNS